MELKETRFGGQLKTYVNKNGGTKLQIDTRGKTDLLKVRFDLYRPH